MLHKHLTPTRVILNAASKTLLMQDNSLALSVLRTHTGCKVSLEVKGHFWALVGKVKPMLVCSDKAWGGKSFCATQKSLRWYFWRFPPAPLPRAFVLSVWREQLVWCNLEWSFFKAFTQEKLQELWGYSLALRNRKKASLHWQLDPRERWLPACLTGPLGLDEAETEEQSY